MSLAERTISFHVKEIANRDFQFVVKFSLESRYNPSEEQKIYQRFSFLVNSHTDGL